LADVLLLLIFPLATDYQVRNVNIAIVDMNQSTYSSRLVGEVKWLEVFSCDVRRESYPEALRLVEHDKADLILQLPNHFERALIKENST